MITLAVNRMGDTRSVKDLPRCLNWLTEEGAIRMWADYDPRCYLYSPSAGSAKEIAQRLSSWLPGQIWIGKIAITWVCGRSCVWLLQPESIPEVEAARACVLPLAGDCGYSPGNCARTLIRWTGIKTRPARDTVQTLREGQPTWGYRLVLPGRYACMTQYDLHAAYWTLLAKLPSPHVYIDSGNAIYFGGLDREQSRRWHAAIEAIGQHKTLRNAVIGAAAGSELPRTYWQGGQECSLDMGHGPWPGAATLVIRTCYELAMMASRETGAIYSAVDCVISPQEAPPAVWEAAGLTARVQARGDAEVCCCNVYRIGERQTAYYALGSRMRAPAIPEVPLALWSPAWMPALREYAAWGPTLRDWRAALAAGAGLHEERPTRSYPEHRGDGRLWQAA